VPSMGVNSPFGVRLARSAGQNHVAAFQTLSCRMIGNRLLILRSKSSTNRDSLMRSTAKMVSPSPSSTTDESASQLLDSKAEATVFRICSWIVRIADKSQTACLRRPQRTYIS